MAMKQIMKTISIYGFIQVDEHPQIPFFGCEKGIPCVKRLWKFAAWIRESNHSLYHQGAGIVIFPKLFIHIIWQDFYFKKLWVWLKIGYPKRSSPRININPPCLDWKSFWHSGETLIFFTSFYSQCSWPILDMFIVKSPKSSHVQRGSLVTTSPAHP